MNRYDDDPWNRWYGAYVAHRAALKIMAQRTSERRRAINVAAALLLAYMLVGGVLASLAVGLVMAN